jgi:hypothetical protein
VILVAGCSAEQAEYDRCIAGTGGSYEQYKRDSERK